MAESGLPEISTRNDAKKGHRQFYFTGKPCRYGHIAKRWVVNYRCVECIRINEKEYHRLWHKARRASDPSAENDRKREVKYGITREQHEAMYESQDGKCAICKEWRPLQPGKPGHGMTIDHCHITGVIRGMLCQRCNKALGLFRDNPQFLRRAANYLDRSRKPHSAPAQIQAGLEMLDGLRLQ